MLIHHICIQTPCYKESVEFYQKILGFKLVKETPGFHTRAYNSWLKLDNFMIELQTAKNDTVLNPWSSQNAGPVHMGFAVEDVQSAYKQIRERGHLLFKQKNGQEIYKVEDGYLFKVIAPEGTEIEVRDMTKL